jgi:hypothetical protein
MTLTNIAQRCYWWFLKSLAGTVAFCYSAFSCRASFRPPVGVVPESVAFTWKPIVIIRLPGRGRAESFRAIAVEDCQN